MSDVAAVTFGDRVAEAVDAKRSQLLVGLDPRPELLPVELRGDIHRSRAVGGRRRRALLPGTRSTPSRRTSSA